MRRLFLASMWFGVLSSGFLTAGNAQQRPEYARPLSAAEARNLRSEAEQLARKLGVRDATLRAIMRALDLSNAPPDFATLVQLVREKVREAARLEKLLVQVRAELAEVKNASTRSPAQAALARADQAIKEGRFDDADRELSLLEALRQDESKDAAEAWALSVEARADLAQLQLRFDRATDIRLEAAEAERIQSTLRQWEFVFAAADSQYAAGRTFRDVTPLKRALEIYRARALPLVPRERFPEQWAQTQNVLGIVLGGISDHEDGEKNLEQAVESLKAALEVYDRTRFPKQWAMVQTNLGVMLGALGSEYDRPEASEEAMAAFHAALTVYTRKSDPQAWVTVRNDIATELITGPARGSLVSRLKEAIALYRGNLEVVTRRSDSLHWASIQDNLSTALYNLAEREDSPSLVMQAEAAARAALSVYTPEKEPFSWAEAQDDLGRALLLRSVRAGTPALLDQAVAAHRAAADLYKRYGNSRKWAGSASQMIYALSIRAEQRKSCEEADRLRTLLEEVRQVYAQMPSPSYSISYFDAQWQIEEIC